MDEKKQLYRRHSDPADLNQSRADLGKDLSESGVTNQANPSTWNRQTDSDSMDDYSVSPRHAQVGRDPDMAPTGQYDNRDRSAENTAGSERGIDANHDPSRQPSRHDEDYYRWRSAHLKKLDEEYEGWLAGGSEKFSDDFSKWREERERKSDQSGSMGSSSAAGDTATSKSDRT